jgi:hypothetical protein
MTHGKGREFKNLPPLNPDTAKAEQFVGVLSSIFLLTELLQLTALPLRSRERLGICPRIN